MTDMTANIPAVVEEVRVLFEAYEVALVEKDVEVLDATFWQSPHTIRYALHENGYGFDEIHAHRVARPPGPGIKQRRRRLEILTLGRDFAVVRDRSAEAHDVVGVVRPHRQVEVCGQPRANGKERAEDEQRRDRAWERLVPARRRPQAQARTDERDARDRGKQHVSIEGDGRQHQRHRNRDPDRQSERVGQHAAGTGTDARQGEQRP